MRRTEAARELGGFVREHRTDGSRRLRLAGSGPPRPRADARRPRPGGFGFAMELRAARKIRVDTFTEDAREPAATIHRAVSPGEFPRGRGRRPWPPTGDLLLIV
ncbi:hypothetical protein [Streptomyces sp. MCL20-2]|uniref:hypothetical protein n=1 Tax=Streptomyces sp. MCL20-2 TaxID=2967219 RepID=UPI002965FEB9|nr:hypothetical protein [Streptomyces sp. MCL20-2]